MGSISSMNPCKKSKCTYSTNDRDCAIAMEG